jgi:hypothetical protein
MEDCKKDNFLKKCVTIIVQEELRLLTHQNMWWGNNYALIESGNLMKPAADSFVWTVGDVLYWNKNSIYS